MICTDWMGFYIYVTHRNSRKTLFTHNTMKNAVHTKKYTIISDNRDMGRELGLRGFSLSLHTGSENESQMLVCWTVVWAA